MIKVGPVTSPWENVLATVRQSMPNKIVDMTRTPGRPRLVLRAIASHTPTLISAPTTVTVSVPVITAPSGPGARNGCCCLIAALSAGVVAIVVTMLTAASAAPRYISLTALIMDWGGVSRAVGDGAGTGATVVCSGGVCSGGA